MAEKIKYNDVPLFAVLIPLINAINYYLSYTDIKFNSCFIFTFLLDTFLGYLAWLGVRYVILYLDREMDFLVQPLKRIMIQLLVTTSVGLAIIISLTETVNWLVKDTPVPANFYTHDIFLFIIWFLVINGIYIGIYLYRVWHVTHTAKERSEKIKEEGFSVKIGNSYKRIDFIEIIGFFVDGEYVTLYTKDGREHLIDLSLDKVEKALPKGMFFRLNRQALVHRNGISGYRKDINGKLIATIKLHNESEAITISRTKAREFKEWFGEALVTD